MSTAELATSYAALILADDGVDITVWPPHIGHCTEQSDAIYWMLTI
jgi:hypothetical protein